MEAVAVRVLYPQAQTLQVAMALQVAVVVRLRLVVPGSTLAAVAAVAAITLVLMEVRVVTAAVEQVVTVIMHQHL
jgi:hypothetical protein